MTFTMTIEICLYIHVCVRYDTQEMITILLDPDLNTDRICKTQPTDVAHNAAFFVDVSKLKCVKNLYRDDMGSWHCNGAYKSWIEVDFTGYITIHGNSKPSLVNEGFYHITKKSFFHKTSKDLKKTVSLHSGMLLVNKNRVTCNVIATNMTRS